MQRIKRLNMEEKAQGMVEYGLILALISVAAVSAIGGVGDKVTDTYSKVGLSLGTDENSIEDLIREGYIAVASPEDVQAIGRGITGETKVWAKGTEWEHEADGGLNKLNGKFIQVQDIDMSGIENFEPIGTYGMGQSPFTGEYNGRNLTIKNLKINQYDKGKVGLFGTTEGVVIENVNLVNVDISGDHNVGGLVGFASGGINKFSNVHVSGRIVGGDYLGGLSGYARAEITNSSTSVSITHNNKVNQGHIGGLVGMTSTKAMIIDSSSSLKTNNAQGYVGGLVGWNKGAITKSNGMVDIKGNVINAGGLVGQSIEAGTIDQSYSEGSIDVNSSTVGGLVGYLGSGVKVEASSSSVSVKATGDNVGGLIGDNYGHVVNSYATGSVLGDADVGGLVGDNKGIVKTSYASGLVKKTRLDSVTIGGLVGKQNTGGTLVGESYYNQSSTGQKDLGKGIGLSAEAMIEQSNFKGWDFNRVWVMGDLSPVLRP